MKHTLNDEQSTVIAGITTWLSTKSTPYFVLSGSAGTGKTFCIRQLAEATRGRFIFTAPTNKATKVLRDSLTTPDYKPECRTIYSLLGLRLEANGEVKELKTPDNPIDLSQYKAVVVDEASMVNSVLFSHIKETACNFHINFIFLGDPAQLPPVGEDRSPIWKLSENECLKAQLTKVMRHDNQILELATRLRDQVDRIAPTIKLAAANAEGEGVWKMTTADFMQEISKLADAGDFFRASKAKIIAWRNMEVDRFNREVRRQLFGPAPAQWLPGDRVLFTSPAKDLDDEIVATTDDEGEITRIEEEWHDVYTDFKVYRISITLDDNRVVTARILHPNWQSLYAKRVFDLSTEARLNSRRWKNFWEFKEAFHDLRHAYAITAHRAQGSTYETAFVYWQDILLNRNRQEAFRCLYVACTRPSKRLILS